MSIITEEERKFLTEIEVEDLIEEPKTEIDYDLLVRELIIISTNQ
jgi:hypothetical protein